MSILIDLLVEQATKWPNEIEINNKYYLSKWKDLKGFIGFKTRIKDSFRVLIGKSRAYHFKEDVIK